MNFEVTAAAREDLAAAVRFYNSQPERLGAAFSGEFARASGAIAGNPRLYSPVEDEIPGLEIREYLIARFGQRVIYRVVGEDVLVVAVVHTSRRPGAWHRRVPPAE